MFQVFMRQPASTDVQNRTQAPKYNLTGARKQKKNGVLTSYALVVNYLLKTYGTNESTSNV